MKVRLGQAQDAVAEAQKAIDSALDVYGASRAKQTKAEETLTKANAALAVAKMSTAAAQTKEKQQLRAMLKHKQLLKQVKLH